MNPVSVLTGLDPRFALLGVVLLGMFGLLRYWMKLKFLRSVYDRAGSRKDLEVAGRVAEPRRLASWPTRRTPRRSSPRTGAIPRS